MKITTILKIILIIIITGLTVSIIKFRLYDADVLASIADTVRSHYYTKNEEKDLVVPVRKEDESTLVPAFQNLPPNYLYTGHILIYYNKEERSLDSFLEESFQYTRYLKLADYKKRIQQTNSISGDTIEANIFITIPGTVSTYIYNLDPKRKKEIVPARTLYFTGRSICSSDTLAKIPEYKKSGINAVVFDVKDIPGHISYKSKVPEVIEMDTHKYRSTDDMSKVVRYLKSHDIYVIARIACFRDTYVTKKRPQWAMRDANGSIWNLGKGEIWLDPTNKHAQDYTIAIAKEAALLGVDEIQFDYIRFPPGGDQSNVTFAHSFGSMSRVDTITNFLKRAYTELHVMNVFVSIDIFGIVAWGYKGDVDRTGQQISKLAQYCDVISPMLYPSHFNDNFRGFAKPGDNPYYFIAEGVKMVQEQAPDTLVRPWLQAFAWRVSNYNSHYIQEQVKASNDQKASGYLFWNAKNSYGVVLKGMSGLAPDEW